jgi:hypothetical protein
VKDLWLRIRREKSQEQKEGFMVVPWINKERKRELLKDMKIFLRELWAFFCWPHLTRAFR